MDIQVSNVNFTCRKNVAQIKPRKFVNNLLHKIQSPKDIFIRTTFDVNRDLKRVKLKEKINEGRSAEVYSTNFDNLVIRIIRGIKFKPKELTAFDDPNGLIVAKDAYNMVQLMKFVKGKPLYGKDWRVLKTISKKDYMKQFGEIQKLPDETFAQYMRDIMKIRQNGYDIDSINPNNFLLYGTHIGIVDLEKDNYVTPRITVKDFDPLINKHHLLKMFKTMTKDELNSFADGIKILYTRLTKIALKEGYDLEVSRTKDGGCPLKIHLVNYLYYKNWNMIKELIDKE